MAHGDLSVAWNEALPLGTNWGYEIDDFIRQTRQQVREGLAYEHDWPVAGTAGFGLHKPGECGVCEVDTTANIDLLSDIEHSLAYDTDKTKFVTNTGAAWTEREIQAVADILTITGATPEVNFVDSDEVSPAGKTRIVTAGNDLIAQGRNAADDAWEDILTFTRAQSGSGTAMTFGSSGSAFSMGGSQIKDVADPTEANDALNKSDAVLGDGSGAACALTALSVTDAMLTAAAKEMLIGSCYAEYTVGADPTVLGSLPGNPVACLLWRVGQGDTFFGTKKSAVAVRLPDGSNRAAVFTWGDHQLSIADVGNTNNNGETYDILIICDGKDVSP